MHAKAVLDNIAEIFNGKKYADKVIERSLKFQKNRGSSDRAFIAEYTYEMVRWWRLILYCNDPSEKKSDISLWHAFATLLYIKGIDLPRWDTLDDFDFEMVRANYQKAQGQIAVKESFPNWMDKLFSVELGRERWHENMVALNQPAEVILRVNTLKTTKEDLVDLLEVQGIAVESHDQAPDALILKERQSIFNLEEFKNGLFEVQDAGSQQIGQFLQVEPGMRVVDACAGAGGKTLHLSAMMQNKGSIVAMDLEEWKLEELKKRARRAGSSIIQTRVIDSTKTIKRMVESCDRLLLDVPCSGLGVLRRNPDAKWKLSHDFIHSVIAEQAKILTSYSRMVKPGGKLVYATCSILPSENEKQIEAFLAEFGNQYTLEDQKTLYPAQDHTDGFFMARLLKK